MLGTVLSIREPRVTIPATPFRWKDYGRGLLTPFRDHDFRWVFWTRFLWVMGDFTVQEFLQYYMRDVVQVFTFLDTGGEQPGSGCFGLWRRSCWARSPPR